MKATYVRQAWLVLVLAGAFSVALGGVYITLNPRIRLNQRNETYSQIPRLVPGAEQSKTSERTLGRMQVYKAFDAAGRCVGWVIRVGGQGYADRLELLIGVDAPAEKITGLYVLEQKETPGLGNHIVDKDWRGQFVGLSAAEPVRVTRRPPAKGNEIVAITGATISSQSVCGIVNDAVQQLREAIKSGELK